MAVWSSISETDVLESGRIDADYFQPDDLQVIRKIAAAKGSALESIASILNGRTPQGYDSNGSVAVVRSGDLVSPLIYPTCGRPFLRTRSTQKHVRLQQGDILISSIGVGSIGKISLVIDPASLITVSEVTVLRNAKIPPEYLFAYLASETGQSQIKREITGTTGQQHLLKSKVAKISIPAMSDNLESLLRDAIQKAYEEEQVAQLAYAEAETLLESALGLDKFDSRSQVFYERSCASARTASRFDAEYFHPRMQNLITILAHDEQTIIDVAKLSKRRFRPKSGREFHYIEIGDVSGNGTTDSNSIADDDAPSRATRVVKSGDIITTTVRPVRRLSAMITDEQDNFVCSSGFAVLTPKEIAPELLLVYLRLPLVCELLDLHTTASMYPSIAPEVLMKIPVALPDNETQLTIVAKVQESLEAQRESRQLLKEAIMMVEETVFDR